MSDVFWLDDPKVLFDMNHITEILPPSKDSFEQKLNAVTRLVILLTLLGFVGTGSVNILVSAVITLVIIVIVFKTHQTKNKKKDLIKQIKKEGFANPEVYKSTKNSFTAPTKKNPLMNVLLPEIQDQPKRKPAAPAFNKEVEREINEKTADPRLFLDLGHSLVPAPPHKITGFIFIYFLYVCVTFFFFKCTRMCNRSFKSRTNRLRIFP